MFHGFKLLPSWIQRPLWCKPEGLLTPLYSEPLQWENPLTGLLRSQVNKPFGKIVLLTDTPCYSNTTSPPHCWLHNTLCSWAELACKHVGSPIPQNQFYPFLINLLLYLFTPSLINSHTLYSLTHSLSLFHSLPISLHHSLTPSLIHSLTISLSQSFTPSVIYSITYSFPPSVIHSIIYSIPHLFSASLFYSQSHSHPQYFPPSLIHSLSHTFSQYFTPLCIHSLTHLLLHSLVYM